MNKTIKIANKIIGKNYKPFVIAEISANHNQSLEKALELVHLAAESGVDAIKIQTYTPDTMTLDIKDNEFLIQDKKSLWFGRTLYDLYTEAYMPWEWHESIFKKANELGLIAFSTPFDESAVDFLESLNVPCYKVASFENTDIRLIKKIAQTGKPIIISTGMASINEIKESLDTAKIHGCNNVILLKCTSTYPASPKDSNLITISDMENEFNCLIGLSDHTLGVGVSIASIALGSVLIEKHFTKARNEGGPDSSFSMEPDEMELLCKEINHAYDSLGKITYGGTINEESSKIFKRSLYIVKDLKKGDRVAEDNIREIRPGLGLPVRNFDDLLGKIAKKDIKKGTACSWDLFD